MKENQSIIDVLIVGGGPVGIGLGIELSLFGIKAIIIERHLSPLELPRGQLLNPRSMEIFQRWGIAADIDEATLLPEDFPAAFVFCDSLKGHTYAYLPLNEHENLQKTTPQHFQRLPLWITEEILRKRAEKSECIDLQLGWTVISVKNENDFVKVIMEKTDGSAQKEVRAKYVIGCDGAASIVRKESKIPFEGDNNLSLVQQIVFEAPLTQLMDIKIGSFYYIFSPKMFGGIGAIDGKSLWVAQIPTFSNKPLDNVNLVMLLKKLTGIDTEFKILRTHTWELGSQVAQQFHVENSLLLAGDAAHRISPTGGHGLNLGMGDAANLGWKIAATLQGWGGEKLFASYSAERKLVASQVEKNSKANFLRVKDIRENYPPDVNQKGFEQAILKMSHQYDALGITMGYNYSQSSIVIQDNLSVEPPFDEINYTPSAYPGHMAPHILLADGSNLYGKFGVGFSLLCFKESNIAQIEQYAHQQKIPLTIIMLTDKNSRNIYEADFVLIRPDRHVAWRSNTLPNTFNKIFDQVLGFNNVIQSNFQFRLN